MRSPRSIDKAFVSDRKQKKKKVKKCRNGKCDDNTVELSSTGIGVINFDYRIFGNVPTEKIAESQISFLHLMHHFFFRKRDSKF